MSHKEKTNIDSIFFFVSRIAIFIPLIIIMISLVLTPKNRKRSVENKDLLEISYSPTPVSSQQDAELEELFSRLESKGNFQSSFDFQGPWECHYQTPEMTAQIMIKNQKIYAELKNANNINYYLLSNDCLYQWTVGAKQGARTCGIGEVLKMFGGFAQLGLFSPEKMIQSFLPNNSKAKIPDLSSICVKKTFADNVFQLPTTIVFQDEAFNLPTKIPFMP